MSDSTYTARVTRLMKQIISKDTGSQRDFTLVMNSNLLKTLLFSENITFDGVLPAPLTSTVNSARDTVTVVIPDFYMI